VEAISTFIHPTNYNSVEVLHLGSYLLSSEEVLGSYYCPQSNTNYPVIANPKIEYNPKG